MIDDFTAILIYVDDMLIVGDNLFAFDEVKSSLDCAFTMKNLGDDKYFLGTEVFKTPTGFILN